MLSLYWYRTETNFGDEFSPSVARHCFGTEFRPAGKWNADLVAEGSVLGFALLRGLRGNPAAKAVTSLRCAVNRRLRCPLSVWGSGLLFPFVPGETKAAIRVPRYFALRGELTRRELVSAGLMDAGDRVAFGDPGVFMPNVLGVRHDPQGRTGFVAHACHWQSGEIEKYRREYPDMLMIDPRRSPAEVVSEIAGCTAIYSSSLHGLVAADSLGIPNRWVALETRHASAELNRFKFYDYYSAFGIRREPCSVKELPSARLYDPVPQRALEAARERLVDSAGEALAAMTV